MQLIPASSKLFQFNFHGKQIILKINDFLDFYVFDSESLPRVFHFSFAFEVAEGRAGGGDDLQRSRERRLMIKHKS